MKIHVLHCGTICLTEEEIYSPEQGRMVSAVRRIAGLEAKQTLPVSCYLVEHPHGLFLVDTGWCRSISPDGVWNKTAAEAVLPRNLVRSLEPAVAKGQTVSEQLEAHGIRPEDLDCVILTHLDADHVAGLQSVSGAKRIVLSEDEYFWACRTVYKRRQPWNLWIDQKIERIYYRGSPLGPNHWAIDLFGDESVQLVNLPGHTDGMAAVLLRDHGRFVLLAADAAISPKNWQDMVVPGFGFSRQWQAKSLQWIRETAADPACAAILCSHDPDVLPQILEI